MRSNTIVHRPLSRSNGQTPCLRWATGARSSSKRPTAGYIWAKKVSFPAAIDWQYVRDADPEWLVIAPCGFNLERTAREAPLLESLPGWSELQAVRRGQVVLADGNLTSTGLAPRSCRRSRFWRRYFHGIPAGREGKAWVDTPSSASGSYPATGTSGLCEQPARHMPILSPATKFSRPISTRAVAIAAAMAAVTVPIRMKSRRGDD